MAVSHLNEATCWLDTNLSNFSATFAKTLLFLTAAGKKSRRTSVAGSSGSSPVTPSPLFLVLELTVQSRATTRTMEATESSISVGTEAEFSRLIFLRSYEERIESQRMWY